MAAPSNYASVGIVRVELEAMLIDLIFTVILVLNTLFNAEIGKVLKLCLRFLIAIECAVIEPYYMGRW